MPLLILFIAIPLIEIALFIQLGSFIGLWLTLLIVVLTAILGTYLVRKQGLQVLGQVQQSFQTLNNPAEPLAHGAMILFSGALLLTPGFFTDTIGFLLLVPGFRSWAFEQMKKRVKVASFATTQSADGSAQTYTSTHGNVIDGEFSEVPEPSNETQGPSGWTRH